jgi:hypothetical protein
MKKLLSVLVILCWLTPPAKSQPPPRSGGAVEAYKIRFITQRLNLNTTEAARFWPIYELYSNEEKQAYQVYRNDKNELELQEALLNIRKKYSIEFHKAIDPGKINDFFRAETDFNIMLRQEIIRRNRLRGFQPGP